MKERLQNQKVPLIQLTPAEVEAEVHNLLASHPVKLGGGAIERVDVLEKIDAEELGSKRDLLELLMQQPHVVHLLGRGGVRTGGDTIALLWASSRRDFIVETKGSDGRLNV